MMKTLFKPAQLTTAVAVAISAPAVLAHNHETVVTLDPIVITATRAAEKASAVPATISVIDRKTIEQNPALNVSDLLVKDAAISIKQSGGIGQIPEVSLRGTSSKHTLFLKDGVRLNTENDLAPVFSGFFDTSDLERIEVLKGPASVQYGTDAISGVVQLVSQTPTKNGAFVTGIYGENETYKAIVGADLVAENGLYAQVRGQRLESDGTRIFASQAESNKAGYDQKGYSVKVGYDQKGAVKAHIAVSQNEGTSVYSDNYSTNDARRQFDNRIISGQVSLKSPVHNAMPEVTLRVSNAQDLQNVVSSFSSYYDTETNEVDLNAKWNLLNNNNVLIGLTQRDAELRSNNIIDNKQSVESNGFYVQHQYNSKKLNTQLGARIEDNERFGSHAVGQGAIRYNFTPATSIYANVGSAFRAPTVNELYAPASWGGNPELQPEESFAYELGLTHQVNNALSANITAYHNRIKNLISYTWPTGNTNIDRATFTGGEAGLKFKQGDFFVNAQYAFVDTENKATKREIAYRPKHKGIFTVGLENETYGISSSVIARSQANADNSANPVKVPSQTTVDLNAYWNISPYVKVFTNVQNIADKQHKNVYKSANFWTGPADWYINAGRQANIGLTLKY